jgi:histidinol-phosphate aminotransferase
MSFPVPFRKNLFDIKPYVPGKPIEELERELGIKNASKLASNENPLGPSPKVLRALEKALAKIHRYPDGAAHNLSQSLSKYLGVNTNQLILGHGSNELLVLLGQMVLNKGDEVIYAENSFFVYTHVCRLFEAVSKKIPLNNYTHDMQAFSNALTSKTRLVFICNPNNPTGTMVPLLAIEAFLRICPKDVLVIVDEAYYEYVEEKSYFESLKLMGDYPNLVVLRTFSKAFGLAGLRVGYGVAHPDLVEVYQKTRQPFNVNSLAMVAAEEALKDIAHIKKVVKLNKIMRKKLSDRLVALDLKPVPTQANFVYFNIPKAPDYYQALLKKGIIIRPMGSNALRVTTGTEEETLKFLKIFEKILMTVEVEK